MEQELRLFDFQVAERDASHIETPRSDHQAQTGSQPETVSPPSHLKTTAVATDVGNVDDQILLAVDPRHGRPTAHQRVPGLGLRLGPRPHYDDAGDRLRVVRDVGDAARGRLRCLVWLPDPPLAAARNTASRRSAISASRLSNTC